MKMKRSKIDIINATVESYLKRRGYQVIICFILLIKIYKHIPCEQQSKVNLLCPQYFYLFTHQLL